MKRKTQLLVAGAAVAAVVAIAAVRLRGDEPAPGPGSPPTVVSAPAAASTAAPAPVVVVREVTGEGRLALPDGTFVPMLNDAIGALSLAECWGARPWSPIVRTERSDLGVDWYVHADGTRTTTEMKWRPDLRRFDALTRIAVPNGEPPPVKPPR